MNVYPQVSVIISTYNRPKMLDRALASVHAQTFTDFEVIVVDDCSPCVDEMQALMGEWEQKFLDRGINLLTCFFTENTGNQCVPKRWGIENSRGDYIAYLDDDNEWHADHLATVVEAIESDFSHDMVYTRLRYVVDDDEAHTRLGEAFGGHVPEGDTIGQPWNPRTLLDKNYIDTSTILHSKGAYCRMVREEDSEWCGWDPRSRRMGDWTFVRKWALYGNNAKLVDKVTVDYHWHKDCLQLTRPLIEQPMTFNYAQWIAVRKETDDRIGYTGIKREN